MALETAAAGAWPARFSAAAVAGGASRAEGKTILLHSELGLGDTLLFCRYATEVAALGAKVVLEVQPPLLPLLADLEGVTEILPRGAPLPAFD